MRKRLELKYSFVAADLLPLFTAAAVLLAFTAALHWSGVVQIVHADNFTDVFYTNSFRGSFEWFKKMDWIGMVVQAVISVFSLVGVALIIIRIMTSMLYLSAKGLWEEVHDQKESGESEMYDFGLVNMAKSWAKGKAGTGLDAIIGAVLILLPDVKRYSDFGEKSGQKFEEDISIGQYMLKILLPTIIAVFCLAMGFNGTLVKGIAVTVDAMGTVADRAVSVNYSGFIDDLVNAGSGFKFTFEAEGTSEGKFKQSMAKDLYGRLVSEARGASEAQLYSIGLQVQNLFGEGFRENILEKSTQLTDPVRAGLEAQQDRYFSNLGYQIIVNTDTSEVSGEVFNVKLSEVMSADGVGLGALESDTVANNMTYHIYVYTANNTNDAYFNFTDAS